MTALLEARNVTKVFGGGMFRRNQTVAVDNISLELSGDEPSVTVVAGESGSGKTTLARLLLGIIRPTSGEVLYNGQDIGKLRRAERKNFRREIQAVFQDPFESYNPFYKVDHVMTAPAAKFNLARTSAGRRKLVEEALEMVGLRPEETLGRFPHQLSGGQRQRVMVARALLLRPRVIVADEAVSMVDASLRATILENLLTLNTEFGISIIYITHDLTTAYQVGQNIVVLYQGAMVEAGDVELVIKAPKHPYTQLLVSSIPHPDPNKTWEDEEVASTPGASGGGRAQCLFADRCAQAMNVCREQPPPQFLLDQRRAASCFLYADKPTLEEGDLNRLLSASDHAANAVS